MSLSGFGDEFAHDLLPQLRELANSRMGATNGASTGTIRRLTGGFVIDGDGNKVPEWSDVYTDLPARIGSFWGSGPSKAVGAGGIEEQVANRVLSLPASTTDLRDGDHFEVTAGENAGSVWRIEEVEWQDQSTARRVPVVQTTRPAEWGAV